ncbi:hypothetical protein [Corynebacterium mayonis]
MGYFSKSVLGYFSKSADKAPISRTDKGDRGTFLVTDHHQHRSHPAP